MKIITKFWIGIAVLIILSPLGLLLPEHFKAGAAWGEWGIDEIKQLAGYVPQGLAKLSNLWNAPIPEYAFKANQEQNLPRLSFSYVLSAVIGVVVTVSVTLLIARILIKKENEKDVK